MSAAFHVEHASRSSRIGLAGFAIALVGLAAAPAWGGRDDLRLLSEIYAYVALASLWNLLAGYAGLVSVGQQAYVGLGAYVLFGATILFGMPPLVAVPVAGVIAAVISLPVAGLMFRLRGHYFAIGTWVIAEVFRLLSSQISALGGGSGISLPAGIVTGMWAGALGGVYTLPANGTQIAAANFDLSGTTKLGTKLVDHSFFIPMLIMSVVTIAVGALIGGVFF